MYTMKYGHIYPLFVPSKYLPVPTMSASSLRFMSFSFSEGGGDNLLSPHSTAHMFMGVELAIH